MKQGCFALIMPVIFILSCFTVLRIITLLHYDTSALSFQKIGEFRKYFVQISRKQSDRRSNCYKVSPSDSYIICNDSLPFTNTECGKPSDKDEEYSVPNIIHYVWFGEMDLKFYHYLSVRSAAANQKPEAIIFHINGSKPGGKYWKRVEEEIPCIRLEKMKEPSSFMGNNISYVLHQTDVARMQILLKHGGIYLDSDAIVLRSLDPLRKYPFIMGRSTEESLSNGVLLSQPNSTFLSEWLALYRFYNTRKVTGNRFADFSVKLPFRLHVMKPDLPVHVEDRSMQRPNPWIDGRACISHESFNISTNYILHLHPQKSLKKDPKILLEYRENELRTYDTTYGAGARAALFGTQDLIFDKTERKVAKNRIRAKNILMFKPISKYTYNILLFDKKTPRIPT